MKIASEIAGFSLAKADLMRRAMGKKDKELMAAMKKEFIDGAASTGSREGACRRDLRPHREVRLVRVQQVAQRRLLGHRLPDGVSQGALSGGVHGGDPLVGNRDTDKIVKLIDDCRKMGHRGPPARRQRKRAGFQGGGRRDPVRAVRDQERRRKRDRDA